MSEWQPIDTAPHDGTNILAWGEAIGHLVVEWTGQDYPWMTLDGPSYHNDAFTHWMPLPTPPLTSPKGEGAA